MQTVRQALHPSWAPPPVVGTKIRNFSAGLQIASVVRFRALPLTASGDNSALQAHVRVFSMPRQAIVRDLRAVLGFNHSDTAAQGLATAVCGLGTTGGVAAAATLTGTLTNIMGSSTLPNLKGGVLDRVSSPAAVMTKDVFINIAATWPNVTTTGITVSGFIVISTVVVEELT